MNHQPTIEAQLLQQTRLQDMLMDIASTYISMPVESLNKSIESTLGAIGKFVEADRVYIFEYDFAAGTCSNTYEWCEKNIAPQIESLQDVPLTLVPDWLRTHLEGQTMYIPDVLALPEDSGSRQILEPQNIKSLIAVPMMQGKQCVGFVGIDSVRHHYNYSTAEQRLLLVFAQMLVNVFERRDMELALREAKNQAETSSKAKSEFLANMSHEIRTPLNAVVGFTELLLNTPLTADQQEYVNHANISGHVLLGVVNDILDLSKIEARQFSIELLDANVLDTLHQAKSVVTQLADQKGLKLKLWHDNPNQVPTQAKFDPLRLRQVLVNLLNNAVKFTEQGEVELKLEARPEGDRHARFRISVRDTGIGISPEQREKVFESFVQADNSITRRFGGTGLGLALSRLMVEKMGGKLDLDSTVGVGTVFWFELVLELSAPAHPLPDQDEAPQGATAPTPTDSGGRRVTVLVVEDVHANRLLIKALLRKLYPNIRVLEACNGQEATEVVDSEVIDLVLMDVHMPVMDGIAATRCIRAMKPQGTDLPIFALTASAIEDMRQKCLESGMNGFLTKPIRQDLLHLAIKPYLASSSVH